MIDQDEINRICSKDNGVWGLHLIAFFHSLNIKNSHMTFSFHKEAFFEVLEKLLSEGKIAFDDPYGEPWTYDPYSSDPNRLELDEAHLWKAKPQEIIVYLRERWPKDANDEHDLELNYYFYEMPSILWKDDDGKWYGS